MSRSGRGRGSPFPVERFETFCRDTEPRLRRALSAAYGPAVGVDAAADAMVWACEHADQVLRMENPSGYLYRVGQSAARRLRRPTGPLFVADHTRAAAGGPPEVEPRLLELLERLTEPQRVCVVLVHAYQWTQQEVADLLEVEHATVRTHLSRAMTKLRTALEVDCA